MAVARRCGESRAPLPRGGASLDNLAEDPAADHVAKRGPGFMTIDGRTTKLSE